MRPPPPPPGQPAPGAQMATVQGRILQVLHGPRGDMNGAILDDGTTLKLPPPSAWQMSSLLQPGQSVAAQGWSLSNSYGHVVDVQSIAFCSTGSCATLAGSRHSFRRLRRQRPAWRRRRHRHHLLRRAAELAMFSFTDGKVTIMHWIDPTCLPETQGLLNALSRTGTARLTACSSREPRQTLVLMCTPPHMAAEIEAAVQIGDTISVRGIRPRGADIIAAVALTAGHGEAIIDSGPGDEDRHEPRHRGNKPIRMEAEGVVRLSLFGPKGELRGALLEDGTIVRDRSEGSGGASRIVAPWRADRPLRHRPANQTWSCHCRGAGWARTTQSAAR